MSEPQDREFRWRTEGVPDSHECVLAEVWEGNDRGTNCYMMLHYWPKLWPERGWCDSADDDFRPLPEGLRVHCWSYIPTPPEGDDE